MTKFDALRRYLLPCIHHAAAASSSTISPPRPTSRIKKRISASLRDDSDDFCTKRHSNSQDNNPESPSSSASSSPSTPTPTVLSAPPRSSRTMVIGTVFGHRGGRHVWFCVQQDRFCSRPALLLKLSIPIAALIREMRCGVVRIALEFNAAESDEPGLIICPLRSVPHWTLYCNGRKLGFAVRRRPTHQNKSMFKTMRNITVGAGVLPLSGPGSGSGSGEKEVLYMRANYECVVGNADSESFHLINPEEGPSQELSVFLMRLR